MNLCNPEISGEMFECFSRKLLNNFLIRSLFFVLMMPWLSQSGWVNPVRRYYLKINPNSIETLFEQIATAIDLPNPGYLTKQRRSELWLRSSGGRLMIRMRVNRKLRDTRTTHLNGNFRAVLTTPNGSAPKAIVWFCKLYECFSCFQIERSLA